MSAKATSKTLAGTYHAAYTMAAGLVFGLILGVLASGCSVDRGSSNAPPSVAALHLAPDFVAAGADGARLSLAESRGRWTTLLFSCGCRHCQQVARSLGERFGSMDRVAVWGITNMNPADTRVFARTIGFHMPVGLDPGSAIQDAYEVEGCPTAVLVDPAGATRERWTGANPGESVSLRQSRLWQTLETEVGGGR